MPISDLGYCDRCEYEFESNRQINHLHGDSSNQYCDDCYEQELEEARERESEYGNESTGIYSYSYKPNTVFYNSDGTFSDRHKPVNGVYELMMGIELETELVEGDYIHAGAQYINSVSNGLIYLKEDCSINHGFEIVSHPMTLNYLQNHAKRYEQSLDFLRKHGYRAWKTSTCGLHIHVSKKSFVDAKHEMKFLYFMFKNKDELIKLYQNRVAVGGFANSIYWCSTDYNGLSSIALNHNFLDGVQGTSLKNATLYVRAIRTF